MYIEMAEVTIADIPDIVPDIPEIVPNTPAIQEMEPAAGCQEAWSAARCQKQAAHHSRVLTGGSGGTRARGGRRRSADSRSP